MKPKFGWYGVGKDGTMYYAVEIFFGISKNGKQIMSGDCDSSCCREIAEQLYAMKMGWTE